MSAFEIAARPRFAAQVGALMSKWGWGNSKQASRRSAEGGRLSVKRSRDAVALCDCKCRAIRWGRLRNFQAAIADNPQVSQTEPGAVPVKNKEERKDAKEETKDAKWLA
jgi:hypothetical protein